MMLDWCDGTQTVTLLTC